MKALFGIVLAGALTLPVAEASANVVYDLVETFAFEAMFQIEFEGTLTLPGFISPPTTFPVADFSVSNNPNGVTSVEFERLITGTSSGACSPEPLECDIVTLQPGKSYIFPFGTLSQTGSFGAANSFFFGLSLEISQTSVVPEPSTWAMMLVGFAGLGFLGYRQTRRAKFQAA